MSRLFFVSSSLEPLSEDSIIHVTFEELWTLFEANLPKKMIEELYQLRLMGDIMNLQAMFYGRELDRLGALHQDELQDQLLIEEKLPDYVIDFMYTYPLAKQRRAHFPLLLTKFFHKQIADSKGFLKQMFLLFYEARLVLAFLRAKKRKLKLEQVFQFEDPKDPFIAFLLAQKDSETTLIEDRFLPLKTVFDESQDIVTMHKNYYTFLIKELENMVQEEPYCKDYIYSYFMRFVLIKRLQKDLSGNGQQFMAV